MKGGKERWAVLFISSCFPSFFQHFSVIFLSASFLFPIYHLQTLSFHSFPFLYFSFRFQRLISLSKSFSIAFTINKHKISPLLQIRHEGDKDGRLA